jgi:hypothetical protein
MSPLNFTHLRRPTTAARLAWLMLLAALLSGCSGSGADVAPVSGRVTLDGAPLAGARIRFQPEASGGSPSYGSADSEGHYVLGYKRDQPGAIIGWHTIRIEPGAADDPENKSKPRALPARYNTASELREEVKAGEDNVIDFELTADVK